MSHSHYGTNALTLGPLPRQGETDARHDLLATTEPQLLNVLEVTYGRSPRAVYESWCERLDGPPRHLFVITLDGQRHGFGREEGLPPGVVVRSVTPYDLTELGMRWQRCLRLLDRTEGRVVIDIDSVTSMLQFASVRTVYRFLHMVTGQIRELGADAQFHVDPAAHEERTTHLLQTTMDEVRQQTFGRHLRVHESPTVPSEVPSIRAKPTTASPRSSPPSSRGDTPARNLTD